MNTSAASFERLWLVIPTADRHQYLTSIFKASGVPEERRILIRTKPGPDVIGATNIPASHEFNIQSRWNQGIDTARSQGAQFVAVLNDDTNLRAGDLQYLLNQIIQEGSDLCHPDPSTTGGWGHCFILKVDSQVRPDERFTWWCGDHDLAIQAKRASGVSIAEISIENIHSNEFTSQNSRMKEIITRDIQAFRRKYPFYTLGYEFYPRLKRKILRIVQSK